MTLLLGGRGADPGISILDSDKQETTPTSLSSEAQLQGVSSTPAAGSGQERIM